MEVRIEDITIPEERARSRWTPEQRAILEGAVKEYGQLSDPLVRKLPEGGYELIDGESRIREFIAAGKEVCDVKIIELNDKDASLVNVLMNIARGEQDPMGIALAFKKAIDEGHDEAKIATATGHSQEWVRFHLNLNIIPDIYQEALQTGQLRTGHVRQAFRLPSAAEQASCLNLAIMQNLKVNVLENYVDNIMAEHEASRILQEYISIENPTPQIDTQKLIHTTRCLACNETKPSGEICHPVICEGCYMLLRYIAPVIGCGQEGIERFNDAINLYRRFLKDQEEELRRQQTAPITIPPGIAVPPTETGPSVTDGTITKPDSMSPEEWERLRQALRTRHSD